nr:hypothetical protein [Metabacillus idriensis]
MPNTSEDFFNRSEVTFVSSKTEKTFHVLYVRYFEQVFTEQNAELFAGQDLRLKDILALICIIQNESLLMRKRLYINTEEEFHSYLKGIDIRAALMAADEMNRHQNVPYNKVVEKVKNSHT